MAIRFDEIAYRDLIRSRCLSDDSYCSADKHSRLTIALGKRKEQRLWKKRPLAERIYKCFLFGFAALFLLDSYFIIYYSWEGWLAFAVFITPLCVMVLTIVLSIIDAILRRKKAFACRASTDLGEFIAGCSNLQNIDFDFLRIVRETLGFVYQVPPGMIYATDTPISLVALEGRHGTPLAFEVILGVAEASGISLSEADVDRISKRIFEHANNVEGLVYVLSEEMHALQVSNKVGSH